MPNSPHTAQSNALEIRLHGTTHEMNRPPPNQDSFLVVNPVDRPDVLNSRGRLIVVCDGMGGEAGGAHASSAAARAVEQVVYSDIQTPPGPLLKAALEQANRQVHGDAMRNPAYRGMGTTCTAVIIHDNQLFIGHVGDTRAYLVRGSAIRLFTKDHSRAQLLVEAGAITKEEAETHPTQSMLVRSVGPKPEVQVDVLGPFPLQDGDQVLVCSDGLNKHVKDNEIAKAMSSLPEEEAVTFLMETARARGGTDNCTVVIAGVGIPRPRRPADAIPPTMIGDDFAPPASRPSKAFSMLWVFIGVAIGTLGGVYLFVNDKPKAVVVAPDEATPGEIQPHSRKTTADANRGGGTELKSGGQPDNRPQVQELHLAKDTQSETKTHTGETAKQRTVRKAKEKAKEQAREQAREQEVANQQATHSANAQREATARQEATRAANKKFPIKIKINENCLDIGAVSLAWTGPTPGKISKTATKKLKPGSYTFTLSINGKTKINSTKEITKKAKKFTCTCRGGQPHCE